MKNVMICASALLAGGMAFAQPPTPSPTPLLGPIAVPNNFVAPPGQKAKTASLTPGVGGNYSLIDQVDLGNDATVMQEGTFNGSFIYQIGDNASNKNKANVLQRGNVQPGVSGEENYAQIDQDGEGNNSKTRQYGDKNDARSNQLGMNNVSSIQQGSSVAEQAAGNLALVDQDGNDNMASVQQRWDNNEASSTQNGDRNKSWQEQRSEADGANGEIAVVSQTGDDNKARQFQQGREPSGLRNYAEIVQGDGTNAAVGAFAQQVQDGKGNRALIDQRLSGDTAFQEQTGNRNKAIASQNLIGVATGGDNYSAQTQDGRRNEAETEQAGNGNKSWQEQVGNDNKAFTQQYFGQGDGNRAISLQDGDMNDSQIYQKAYGNNAFVDQIGSGHMSFITQNQYGTSIGSNPAAFGQNTASVTQRDSGDTTGAQMKTNPTVKALSLNGSN